MIERSKRSDEPGTEPSITLAMIVKDEAAVIERCLDSVRPLLASWVIVDTGSTDDTIERIERSLSDLPGRLHRRPWVDFGHNRTQLMELARGTGTHLLLVDADMTVRIEGPLRADHLEVDALLLRHIGDPSYWIPRLVRSDRPWHYVGATHEYLSLDEPFTQTTCDSLVIEHHGDGGSRHDKFERDRRLLELAVAEDPDDPRSRFYLAQTLRDLGEIDAAIEQYRARVALGGWDEEVFYSQWQLGELLAATDWDAAVQELQHAWEIRPIRAEPLLTLARGWRARGDLAQAYHAARLGASIERPDDLLFVHPEPYEWGLRFELAIDAFHAGDIDESRAACERLLTDGVPPQVEPWVRHNLAWCERASHRSGPRQHALLPLLGAGDLPSLTEIAPSTRFHELVIDVDEGWSRFNPSIASRPSGGYLVTVRSSNYRLVDGEYVDARGGPIGIVRTVNHLVHLDDDLAVLGAMRIPSIPSAPGVDSAIVGLEDIRLVLHDDRWRATAATRDQDPQWVSRIALLELGMGPDAVRSTAVMATIVPGPDPGRHEKNWMPFVVDDDLLVLYMCDPTVVARIGHDRLAVVESATEGPPGSGGFRGGSQGVDIGDGYLFVVHEVLDRPDGRLYAHRLVLLESIVGRWTITAMSAPFHFIEPGIEFCAGLAVDGDRALLSFGFADATAWIAECRLEELRDLLVPVLPPSRIDD